MEYGCPGHLLEDPRKNAVIDKKTEYMDNADRVEVERSFSLLKRCYSLGRIMTKLDVTTKSSIALSILVMNVARIAARSLRQILLAMLSRYIWQDSLPFCKQKCHKDLWVA